jgi:hypothetical protein
MQYEMNTEMDFYEYEQMSLTEREAMVNKWDADLRNSIENLRETGAEIAKIIEANKRR